MVTRNGFKMLSLFMSLAALACLGCGKEAGSGKPAPDFFLEDLYGGKVSLKEFKGNVVVVDFWATWCPPCLMSIPELVDLHNKYKQKGLSIVGISVDDPRQVTDKDLAVFKEKGKIPYPIVRADAKVMQDYFADDSEMIIPTMFVIDREGKIADKKIGFAPGSIEKSIKKLL